MSQDTCLIPVSTPLLALSRLQRLGLPLLLAAFAALLFFPGLGVRDLTSSHEARAAQNAASIVGEGDLFLPRLFDRHVELQKPPLFYWLVAGIAALRGGVDVWAVRLPSACAAWGCVLWLYVLGARRGRPVAGFFAGLVLASCVHFTWLAHVGRVDMPLTLALAVALGCFRIAGDTRRPLRRNLWACAGYSALAVGVLLKGPIALALTAVVVVVNVLSAKLWNSAADTTTPPLWRTLLWGVPWMLLWTVPWFVLINTRTGGRLWDVFFWHHNIERGLGGSDTLAAYPWWFYAPRLAIDVLPWSLLVPPAAWWCIRRRRLDADARAGLCWFASIIVFLSCMSFKRSDYLLPAYPGLAIFLGCVAEDVWKRCAWRSWFAYALTLLLAIYAAGWCLYDRCVAAGPEGAWPYRTIAAEIRARTQAPVIFFRTEAHLLAFHVGSPLDTILEWENLQIWADQDFPVYIVMPAEYVAEMGNHLRQPLQEVLRTTDRAGCQQDRPLVVLRNRQ